MTVLHGVRKQVILNLCPFTFVACDPRHVVTVMKTWSSECPVLGNFLRVLVQNTKRTICYLLQALRHGGGTFFFFGSWGE